MKFATIKALVEEENKPMYAAVVLSDDIFPFELSEKERTCVFLVEPERDQYTVSCDSRIFQVERLQPADYEDMFLIGFTLVPATRDTPMNFQFFTSISDAVDEMFSFIYCDAHEIEHTKNNRFLGIATCKAMVEMGIHYHEPSSEYELFNKDIFFHTDYLYEEVECERRNSYWFNTRYCPSAGVDGHYTCVDDDVFSVEYYVAECHMHSPCHIDVIEASQEGLLDDELANFGNTLKKEEN